MDLDPCAHKLHVLLSDADDTFSAVLGRPMIRTIAGRLFAFAEACHFAGTTGCVALYKIDLDRNAPELMQEGGAIDRGWLVDESGEPLARAQYKPSAQVWSLSLKRSGVWRPVKTVEASVDPPTLLGLGRDGRSTLPMTGGDDTFSLRERPAGDPHERGPLAEQRRDAAADAAGDDGVPGEQQPAVMTPGGRGSHRLAFGSIGGDARQR